LTWENCAKFCSFLLQIEQVLTLKIKFRCAISSVVHVSDRSFLRKLKCVTELEFFMLILIISSALILQTKQQISTMEFGRRMAAERDLEKSDMSNLCNIGKILRVFFIKTAVM
jgi:hypothetical protein